MTSFVAPPRGDIRGIRTEDALLDKLKRMFAVGDVVRLKSGGPAMTVYDGHSGLIQCIWIFNGIVQTYGFAKDIVERVNA